MRALIWDVDGTLAETERDGHRVAFNEAFAAHGLPWRWDVARYGELLAVSGGRQRLLHDLSSRPDAPRATTEREALAAALHRHKNRIYAALVDAGAITLRPGVRRLMDEAREAGARLAIATTTSRSNVEALLARALGPHWQEGFDAVVCAEEAPRLKPDPQAYRQVLGQLALPPQEVLAVEDSPQGLASARAAGIEVLVTRSAYFADLDASDALACCADLESEVQPRAALRGALAPAAPVGWRWLQRVHALAVTPAAAAAACRSHAG